MSYITTVDNKVLGWYGAQTLDYVSNGVSSTLKQGAHVKNVLREVGRMRLVTAIGS